MSLESAKASAQRSDAQGAADRELLFARAGAGLAHEGKNPLHNMVLHLQLLGEKLAQTEVGQGRTPPERHLQALRDGIGRVDALLKAFGDFAVPDHLAPDLGRAVSRAVLLFAYDVRRAGVEIVTRGPGSLLVDAPGALLGDLVAHLLLAGTFLAHGGKLLVEVEPGGARAALHLRVQTGISRQGEAGPHLAAARRLAAASGSELSADPEAAAGARLSLSFAQAATTPFVASRGSP